MKKKHFQIKDLVFEATIDIFSGYDYKYVVKHYNKNVEDFKGTESNADAKCIFGEHKQVYMWFYDFKLTPYWTSVLVHEITHVTQHVLGYSNLLLEYSTGEAYAYYNQFLFREIIKRLCPKK
jgi:hypothetical protein